MTVDGQTLDLWICRFRDQFYHARWGDVEVCREGLELLFVDSEDHVVAQRSVMPLYWDDCEEAIDDSNKIKGAEVLDLGEEQAIFISLNFKGSRTFHARANRYPYSQRIRCRKTYDFYQMVILLAENGELETVFDQKFARKASFFCGRGREMVTYNIIWRVDLLQRCLSWLVDATIGARKLAERGPANGRIAFYMGVDADIYIMDDDGYHQRRLTDTQNIQGEWSPVMSPDGRRIAFSGTEERRAEQYIWVMDVDGSNRRRVHSKEGTQPTWNADGTKLAFVAWQGGDTEIFVVDVAVPATDLVQLTDNEFKDSQPDWSDDDATIVFVSSRDGNADLYLMDADGSNVRPLTSTPEDESGPVLSPDGTKVAYIYDGDVFIMNLDGSDRRNLTEDWIGQRNPCFSGDGGILYWDETVIMAYDLETGEEWQVSIGKGSPKHPSWGPAVAPE